MDVTLKDDGTIRFLEVPEAFFEQLVNLPGTCDLNQSKTLEKRLFPPPVDSSEPEELVAEASADWDEFVKPELEQQSQRSIQTVLADLSGAQAEGDHADDLHYAFEIPSVHVADWYHALNRARIVLAHRHRLPLSEYPLEEGEQLSLERLFAAHLSDRFAEILEVLVSQMMGSLS